MASFYTYLISTLPTLQFQAAPPFSFEEFITYCRRFITEVDIQTLKKISINGEYSVSLQPTIKKWQDFDISLRNELVKARASRKHIDPARYLRKDKFPQAFISNAAISALRNPSIIESERNLDLIRWQALDEFCFGHYFDMDFLIIYCLKLLILERWKSINTQDKHKILEEVLSTQ